MFIQTSLLPPLLLLGIVEIKMLIFAIVFIALLFYLKLRRRTTNSLLTTAEGGLVEELSSPPKQAVLFVTAHPDDECMFFAPTIIALSKLCDVHVLCLSSGIIFQVAS